MDNKHILTPDERVLVTGAAGFIGSRVVKTLMDQGFRNLVCFVRPSSDTSALEAIANERPLGAQVRVLKGNLLSTNDCLAATEDVALILHLAAGAGDKSYSDAFMNSVVSTRNLLDAALRQGCVKRFVNVSSFAVYSNRQRGRVLNEECPVEEYPQVRGDPYCYAKVKQDQIVAEYGRRGINYVIVRPGTVYGPGKAAIPARVGVGTFGLFLHLGGLNTLPLTYVDNCADAIVRAGTLPARCGDIFNIVDDDLPSSHQFLRQYKHRVGWFASAYVPHVCSYALCCFWESYSRLTEGQLPPAFNRSRWYANWKRTRYSNAKLKSQLGWTPRITTAEGLSRFFAVCQPGGPHA